MPPVTSTLRASDRPLSERYDVALLDLDGVVYVGPDAVPTAPDALTAARAAGMRLGFVTNNAARPPQAVAEHLSRLGIRAAADEVVTSAQAAAHHLADQLPAGARVLVVGTTGLWEALRERGLTPVGTADGEVAAVVQGYSPDLDWKQLAEGSVAIRRGVPWVATNLDATVPSPRGPLPGNGSLVAALRHATGVTPTATGKPDPTMHREMVTRTRAEHPLVVGDRLDTDIAGAAAVGCASLLVLTGVTSAAGALAASAGQRPTFLGADLRALLEPHPPVDVDGATATCRGWTAQLQGARVRLATSGDGRRDHLDAWRALCGVWWSKGQEGEAPEIVPTDEAAEQAIRSLGLEGH
ncbi:MAG: HAD-IIA family hydrolase [Jatrophihabitans sp.]|uniref:HAD-IIA family hydrolase n=1 Tax=Jatrophihabitans sp. TaxID=1932789 RepID=UPI003F7D7112